MRLSEHAARNRHVWNEDAPNRVEPGRKAWSSPAPWWGMLEVPEEELRILPDVAGLDVVDLGCGAGYRCAWFAKLGASPVGGERIALLRETGFEVEALRELYAPEGDPDELRDFVRRGWAQRWPCEAVWVARSERG